MKYLISAIMATMVAAPAIAQANFECRLHASQQLCDQVSLALEIHYLPSSRKLNCAINLSALLQMICVRFLVSFVMLQHLLKSAGTLRFVFLQVVSD